MCGRRDDEPARSANQYGQSMAYQLNPLGNPSLCRVARAGMVRGVTGSMRCDQPQPEETNEVEI